MKYKYIILAALILLIPTFLTAIATPESELTKTASADQSSSTNTNKSRPKTNTTNIWESKSDRIGVVDVEVIPSVNDEGKLVMTLILNNHSIDLDYDYQQIAILTDENVKTYQPVTWTGNQGGHHVSGDLVFDIPADQPQFISLELIGIDNQTTTFQWTR